MPGRGRAALSTVLSAALISGVAAAAVVSTPTPAEAKVPNAGTTTTTLAATFRTQDQSLWGPGNAQGPGTQNLELFDESWNDSAEGGSYRDGAFGDEYGAGGSISTSGRVGMSLDLEGMDGGKVAVNYPVKVDVTTPAPKSFGAGDTIEISTSPAAVQSGAAITTVEPTLDAVTLKGTVGGRADASFEICVVDCGGESATLFHVPQTSGQIFRVSLEDLRSVSPGSPADTYCFGSAEKTALGLTEADRPTRCSGNGGYVARPNPVVSTTTNADGSLSASGTDTFALLPISAMKWVQRLVGDFPLNKSIDIGPLDLSWTTFDVSLNTSAQRTEELDFAAKVDVTLALPRSMSYRVVTPGGTQVSQGTGSSVTLRAGNKVLVDVPTDQTTAFSVTPSLSLAQPDLSNEVTHSVAFSGLMKVLQAALELDAEIFTIGFAVGPAYEYRFSAPSTDITAVPMRTWALAGFNAPTLAPVQIVPAPPPVVSPVTVTPVEGAPTDLTVATFTDEVTTAVPSDYAATISWGDGTPTVPATVTGKDGSYAISARHTYEQYGTYPVEVDLRTRPEGNLATNHVVTASSAVVSDAALTGTGLTNNTTASGQKVLIWANPSPAAPNNAVATFADANPFGLLSDLSATIDWGDGTAPTVGTVSGGVGGPFTVSGAHDYVELGLHTATVTMTSKGGSKASVSTATLSYSNPASGSFLLGGTRATGAVTYWGSQWAKSNGFTGSSSSLKGFANQTAPACGTTWKGSSATGATSLPPSTVPTYMAVTVTDKVTTTGTTATGLTRGVVIVRTNPGYGTAPSQVGTGTVVAVLCGTAG
ncbi:hypothetical protein G7072_05625 [Nocardioides sp. HDW12B]|uniref:hypothetical protein n=1 Tax=Nocardioides sp. HDW12B TaxID=2714939 RepID=UPI00140B8D68|nr:hypothetical protein [Nocardioides sp. HDW12B]QIK65883.1 hypothetical protein G7072_05625 [Nocardioides sp. HDW12B]